MTISPKLPLKKMNTVHNLFTFSIVFTDENVEVDSTPPPHQK